MKTGIDNWAGQVDLGEHGEQVAKHSHFIAEETVQMVIQLTQSLPTKLDVDKKWSLNPTPRVWVGVFVSYLHCNRWPETNITSYVT